MPGTVLTDIFEGRQGSAPTSPASGKMRMYWKTGDVTPYLKDSAGVEYAVLLDNLPVSNKILLDNLEEAWAVETLGGDKYMSFKTEDGAEESTFGADPVAVPASRTNVRSGIGGTAVSSEGAVDIDGATSVSINSSSGAVNLGTDNVAQPVNIGTSGARTITRGNTLATIVETAASYSYNIKNNVASPYSVKEGANKYYEIVTTTGSEAIKHGNVAKNPKHQFLGTGAMELGGPISLVDNVASAYRIVSGVNEYMSIDTLTGAERVLFSFANVAVLKNLAVDGVISTKMGIASGAAITVGGSAYVNDDVSNTVTNTTQETPFNKSKQFVANTFGPARKLSVRATGNIPSVAAGGQNLTIRLRLLVGAGPTTVAFVTAALVAVGAGHDWIVEFDGHVLSIGAANARTLAGTAIGGSGPDGAVEVGMKRIHVGGIDTTQQLSVEVSAQWANADAANQVYMSSLEVDIG